MRHLHRLALLLLLPLAAAAQSTPTSPPPAEPPHGDVLFQSHGDPPAGPEDTTARALAQVDPAAAVPEALRSSIAFTGYDLDARIDPAAAFLNVRARITVRNTGRDPLAQLVLQISSSLTWSSISFKTQPLPFTQHLLETDADHTGRVSEADVPLPQPLAPGASVTLDTLYAGTIQSDATRLERIGATAAQALDTDWDAIGDTALSSSSDAASTSDPSLSPITLNTALRGFGNVIWYPVAAPALFLGDGAKLFQAVGELKASGASSTMRLRLAVEYHGDPPTAAYFCGRRQPLVALPDDPDAPTATGAGIATAEFSTQPLGFRLPSLFVIERPETLIAPLPQGESSSAATSPGAAAPAPESPTGTSALEGAPLLAVETTNDEPLQRLAATAQNIAPLLQRWLGAHPLTALAVLDHRGEPFEDGPVLVAPVPSLAATTSTPALVHSLTHAWVQTGQPWFDEGLAQFMGLLWTEQQQGREAAVAQLGELVRPVALAEPAFTSADPPPAAGPGAQGHASGTLASTDHMARPLTSATDDLFYRRKAAAVWWMLRAITGDQPLAAALTDWAAQPLSRRSGDQQALDFEHLLERTSHQDLAWFFNDWVLRDRGLPDLTIAAVEPRQLPAGKGHDSGWLVAITVRNDGAAVAEVPVVVRSGTFSTTKRLRIAGFASATDRVLTEAPPTEVLVNDGTTPEVRSSIHSQPVSTTTTSGSARP